MGALTLIYTSENEIKGKSYLELQIDNVMASLPLSEPKNPSRTHERIDTQNRTPYVCVLQTIYNTSRSLFLRHLSPQIIM